MDGFFFMFITFYNGEYKKHASFGGSPSFRKPRFETWAWDKIWVHCCQLTLSGICIHSSSFEYAARLETPKNTTSFRLVWDGLSVAEKAHLAPTGHSYQLGMAPRGGTITSEPNIDDSQAVIALDLQPFQRNYWLTSVSLITLSLLVKVKPA